MIIYVKFEETDKSLQTTLAQNESAVNASFGEFQKVPATANHSDLLERELEDQHPISAISGLQEALDGKQPKGNYLKQADLQKAVDDALAQAKASGEFDGEDGVSVVSVRQTTTSSADGGSNVITVTLSNGQTSTFTVKNGSKGTSVTVSSVSESTANGGSNVVIFSDGKRLTVKNGTQGAKGDKGDTPVKGKDYYTDADKAEMVQAVLAALPSAEGVGF